MKDVAGKEPQIQERLQGIATLAPGAVNRRKALDAPSPRRCFTRLSGLRRCNRRTNSTPGAATARPRALPGQALPPCNFGHGFASLTSMGLPTAFPSEPSELTGINLIGAYMKASAFMHLRAGGWRKKSRKNTISQLPISLSSEFHTKNTSRRDSRGTCLPAKELQPTDRRSIPGRG
jgi:hypothetical protein